ncbi:hypothetical protein D3C81_1994520 [compost metagenome]
MQFPRVFGEVHQGLPVLSTIFCHENSIEGPYYIPTALIDEKNIHERLSFPFNRKGAFTLQKLLGIGE